MEQIIFNVLLLGTVSVFSPTGTELIILGTCYEVVFALCMWKGCVWLYVWYSPGGTANVHGDPDIMKEKFPSMLLKQKILS